MTDLRCPYCGTSAPAADARFTCLCWYRWRVVPGGGLTRYLPPVMGGTPERPYPLAGCAPTPLMLAGRPFTPLPLASREAAAEACRAPAE